MLYEFRVDYPEGIFLRDSDRDTFAGELKAAAIEHMCTIGYDGEPITPVGREISVLFREYNPVESQPTWAFYIEVRAADYYGRVARPRWLTKLIEDAAASLKKLGVATPVHSGPGYTERYLVAGEFRPVALGHFVRSPA